MKRTILVTGAAGNLGGAVLAKYLDEGFRVAAVDSPSSSSKIPESADVKLFPADLADERMVDEVMEEVFRDLAPLEMAVLTVGGFAMGKFEDTSSRDFEKMYRLNFVTAYNTARHVYRRMQGQEGGGQIVFIGSRPALHPEQAKDLISYSLSKSLLFRLAEVINEEGRSGGISAYVVVPSIIDTPLNRVAMPEENYDDWVTPSELAENIYHLSTPAGKKIRESVIKVYGNS
jgi:NAD(P)-dependent dehydrogenase (short-subunit alcohol dehydrogenase family)